MRKIVATLALVAVACGGGEADTPATNDAGTGAEPGAAQTAPAPTGAVHTVQMLLTDDGQYVYEPATLTIRVGDTVRWVNTSGGPHNVAFYADQIPAGSAEVLSAAITNRMPGNDLSGGLIIAPDAVFEMSFSGMPTGNYGYFCTPHEMLGMTATLTITE